MVHAARAIAGLILALTALSATAAPRVATHDDGSAAVTLDGGLTIVLGRAVTREVRSRGRTPGGLQRVIDRHAGSNRLRARAIRAYARTLAGTGRDAPDRAARRPAGTATPSASRPAAPARPSRPDGAQAARPARPLGTDLGGFAHGPSGDPATAPARRTRDGQTQSRRPGAAGVSARPRATPRPAASGATMRPRTGATRPRTRAPQPGTNARRRPQQGPELPQRRDGERLATRRPTQAPGAEPTPPAGTGGAGDATTLPAAAETLLSSSLATTVVGPDRVASPSGLSQLQGSVERWYPWLASGQYPWGPSQSGQGSGSSQTGQAAGDQPPSGQSQAGQDSAQSPAGQSQP